MKLKDCLVGGGRALLTQTTASGVSMSSLPRGYAEKCFDFDCIKVEQIILIFRGTQQRFPPSCIGNTF